ncbi:hypothetical protein GALL_481550 [mine drainage metagenome]|uniref:Uncharacterized protein n=1 Tax=mine drainage metagenome TaxID=410659 RepID=A0A1J5PRM6_9ZZZZ
MTITNNPKTWFILLLLAFIFSVMLIMIRYYHSDAYYQEKIDNHSEIVDTI